MSDVGWDLLGWMSDIYDNSHFYCDKTADMTADMHHPVTQTTRCPAKTHTDT
jgi:hypothetical protein